MGRFYWLCCCTNCFQLFLRKFNIFALKKYHGSIITHSNESLIASQIQFNGKEKYFTHIVRFSLKTFIARSAVLKSIEKILLCILNSTISPQTKVFLRSNYLSLFIIALN